MMIWGAEIPLLPLAQQTLTLDLTSFVCRESRHSRQEASPTNERKRKFQDSPSPRRSEEKEEEKSEEEKEEGTTHVAMMVDFVGKTGLHELRWTFRTFPAYFDMSGM